MSYIDINDKYETDHKDEYFACIFPIKYTNKKKDYYEPKVKGKEDFLFTSLSSEITEDTVAGNYYSLDKDKYRILPYIKDNVAKNKNTQRCVVAVWGSSGSGKSYLIDLLAKTFALFQDKRPMYYISSKNMPIDPSFSLHLYDKFYTLDQFLDLFKNDEDIKGFETNSLFDNSLLIFDDLVFESKEIKKKFYRILNIILTLKRMNNISVIYCYHEQTDYIYTRTLYNELTQYICYPSMDIKNRTNRVLVEYFKLTPQEINYINQLKNTRWVCINTKKKCIICDHSIKLLD